MYGSPALDSLEDAGLRYCEDVLAVPLSEGTYATYRGGLVDSKIAELVPEAVHFDGTSTQEPPDRDWIARLPAADRLLGTWLYGGLLFDDFPHFMLEGLGRLWAANRCGLEGTRLAFFAPWGVPDSLSPTNFVNQALRGFNIDPKRIVIIDQPVQFQGMIIPVQQYGYQIASSPDASMLSFLRSFRVPSGISHSFNEKIYVSRFRLPANRGRPVAEHVLEDLLRRNGYSIFHPEEHDLYTQISVYSSAKKLIFCDGGAVHGCILLPDLKADVAVVARRRDPRWDGSEIGDQFRGFGNSSCGLIRSSTSTNSVWKPGKPFRLWTGVQ
jgi:hypothetical protein